MANPFVSLTAKNVSRTSALPLLTEYAYDFEKRRFRYDENGQHLIVTENEALKVWIFKALLTERYRYLAYDDAYGISIEPYQGRTPNSQFTAEQIAQELREGLLVNPYIVRINQITVEKREQDDLYLAVDVTSIYSDSSVQVVMERRTYE